SASLQHPAQPDRQQVQAHTRSPLHRQHAAASHSAATSPPAPAAQQQLLHADRERAAADRGGRNGSDL
ncbi:hypothetical protein KR067_011071, partial [Drosophila pandora]